MAFARTWDATYEAAPADSNDISQGADRIREIRVDVRERLEIDHSWAGDADDGKHKKLTFVDPLGAKPTAVTDEGYLYTKNVSAKAELFWEDEDGNELQITSVGTITAAMKATTLSKTAAYTVVAADRGKLILADASGGAFTVTLTAAATLADNFIIGVKKTDSSANAITIDGNAAETIDGAATVTLDDQYDVEWYVCDGSNWHKIVRDEKGIVQVVHTQTGATASGTVLIPGDDTIPQNDEGDEYMTLTITPKNANNILIIEIVANLSTNIIQTITVALFQDTTAGALAAVMKGTEADRQHPIGFRHKMTAGTTSSTTFKIRAGASVTSTVRLNGVSGVRRLGGVIASSITITEIAA